MGNLRNLGVFIFKPTEPRNGRVVRDDEVFGTWVDMTSKRPVTNPFGKRWVSLWCPVHLRWVQCVVNEVVGPIKQPSTKFSDWLLSEYGTSSRR